MPYATTFLMLLKTRPWPPRTWRGYGCPRLNRSADEMVRTRAVSSNANFGARSDQSVEKRQRLAPQQAGSNPLGARSGQWGRSWWYVLNLADIDCAVRKSAPCKQRSGGRSQCTRSFAALDTGIFDAGISKGRCCLLAPAARGEMAWKHRRLLSKYMLVTKDGQLYEVSPAFAGYIFLALPPRMYWQSAPRCWEWVPGVIAGCASCSRSLSRCRNDPARAQQGDTFNR